MVLVSVNENAHTKSSLQTQIVYLNMWINYMHNAYYADYDMCTFNLHECMMTHAVLLKAHENNYVITHTEQLCAMKSRYDYGVIIIK
jgi:hypothetical protein